MKHLWATQQRLVLPTRKLIVSAFFPPLSLLWGIPSLFETHEVGNGCHVLFLSGCLFLLRELRWFDCCWNIVCSFPLSARKCLSMPLLPCLVFVSSVLLCWQVRMVFINKRHLPNIEVTAVVLIQSKPGIPPNLLTSF